MMSATRLLARASGMPLLVGLIVATFAIAGDLVYEAWSTARSQRETADRALHEYARFATWSMSYKVRANIYLGLTALFGAVGAQRGAAPEGPAPPAVTLVQAAERIRQCRCAISFRPSYYFRIDPSAHTLDVAGDAAPPRDTEREWLRDTVSAHARTVARGAWDAVVLYGRAPPAGPPLAVAYAVRSDPRGGVGAIYGFVSDLRAFGAAVAGDLSRYETLAPRHVAAQVPLDSIVVADLVDPEGRELFRLGAHGQGELALVARPYAHEAYTLERAPTTAGGPARVIADSVRLDAQFGAPMLHVALRPGASSLLVAGASWRSRLPVLLALLVLSAGLIAVAVMQVRREHELARLRAEFTASVSHELRTPLAQILLFGETLILQRTRSERQRRAAAEVIVREARRLMRLVENALHFSRAERRLVQLSPEPALLAPLVREILVAFAPLAWSAGVTVRDELAEDARAVIDREAFRQILLNLLDNAVKYGPRGQTVTVRLSCVGDSARLVVDDEGAGVRAADRERIWTPFVRAPAAAHDGQAGTGIGLAVVRDLVARHGGRAWVDDASPSAGARFVIDLPAADSGEAAYCPSSSPSFSANLM